MPAAEFTLEFFEDPAAFLGVAGDHLAAEPVVGTVVATVAVRDARSGGQRPVGRPYWFAVVRDESGELAGAAMRTAPFRPYPVFVLPMPEAAATLLARALHERGEEPGAVNGALPAARALAGEHVALAGGRVEVAMHTRLFELGELLPPPDPPGAPRLARESDVDLVLQWLRDFHRAADEQAGRAAGHGPEHFSHAEIDERVSDGRVVLWELPDGTVVHMTGFNRPSFGVARVGPVYTPREHRRRGYAGATVAHVCRLLLDRDARVCLFTDQANPTSNHVYESLGFRPVVDMVNLDIR